MPKMIELERSTPSHARGRNGRFEPRNVSVGSRPGRVYGEKEPVNRVLIQVYSRRSGATAPIWLELSPHDARMVASAILDQADEIGEFVR